MDRHRRARSCGLERALHSQAARLTSLCRLYAPLYRQASGGAMASALFGDPGDIELAQQDVRDAFEHYMRVYDEGRDLVLLGHSQGAHMLVALMQETFDADEALRGQMISALLIGAGVAVAEADVVGGTFEHLPACTRRGQRGCIVAFSSFAADAPPPHHALYGRASEGMTTMCTNPSTLAGKSGLLDSVFPAAEGTNPFFGASNGLPPDVDQPWARYPGMFRAPMRDRRWAELPRGELRG